MISSSIVIYALLLHFSAVHAHVRMIQLFLVMQRRESRLLGGFCFFETNNKEADLATTLGPTRKFRDSGWGWRTLVERCLGPDLQVKRAAYGMMESPVMNSGRSGRNAAQCYGMGKNNHESNHSGFGPTCFCRQKSVQNFAPMYCNLQKVRLPAAQFFYLAE